MADDENKKIIQQQIEKQNHRKEKYNQLSRQLSQTGETQVSTSDPDSRQMITRNILSADSLPTGRHHRNGRPS